MQSNGFTDSPENYSSTMSVQHGIAKIQYLPFKCNQAVTCPDEIHGIKNS